MLMYKRYPVFDSLDLDDKSLIKTDSEGWRQFYQGLEGVVIKFYPFSEYHGGGQPYFIKIGKVDLEKWLVESPDFETEIRALILQTVK